MPSAGKGPENAGKLAGDVGSGSLICLRQGKFPENASKQAGEV